MMAGFIMHPIYSRSMIKARHRIIQCLDYGPRIREQLLRLKGKKTGLDLIITQVGEFTLRWKASRPVMVTNGPLKAGHFAD
jgi:hypothetical protein